MDNKNLVGIVGSIHFETELLEALDWDEEKLKDVTKKLSEYFAVCSKSDLDLIKVDLGFIFSEEIGNIVSKYVRHVKVELQEGEDNEV
tara:strand:- start:649 stop:912 length:264 start_codon:yes stop_codon:yes gene_type:complete